MLLRLLDRYLLREMLISFAAATAVLLMVTFGGSLVDVINKVARGKVPAPLLLSQVGLLGLDALTLLLPLAAFIAVLMAYGRLYRDSEIAIMSSAGMRAGDLMRPLAWIAVPLMLGLAALTFWGVPGALRVADRMVDQANRSLLVAGLEAGRFMNLPGGYGVVYVGELDARGQKFERLFVHREQDGRVDIVTASRGELFQDQNKAERYLRLSEGFRVEGSLEQPNFRTMRFQRNDLRLPEAESARRKRVQTRIGTVSLLGSNNRADTAELHWRLALPIAAGVLMLLAFPLARSRPRESRYARIFAAVMGYVLYVNLLSLGRGWLADGALPVWLGLWWVHGLAIAIALVLLVRGERMTRPRRSAAA